MKKSIIIACCLTEVAYEYFNRGTDYQVVTSLAEEKLLEKLFCLGSKINLVLSPPPMNFFRIYLI